MRFVIAAVAIVAVSTGSTQLLAQTTVWVAGALHQEFHRFPDEEIPSRLTGASTGLTVGGGARIGRRFPIQIEWSHGGWIENREQIRLELPDRTILVESSLEHRAQSLGVLGGFHHHLTRRIDIAYLAGVSRSRVVRTFLTNAPSAFLIPPSTIMATGSATTTDIVLAFNAGSDMLVRLKRSVHLLVGARYQQLPLSENLRGWSLRSSAGVAWVF